LKSSDRVLSREEAEKIVANYLKESAHLRFDAKNICRFIKRKGFLYYVKPDRKINSHSFNPILRKFRKENKIRKCSQKLWEVVKTENTQK
jgi:hypothetical protein